MEKNNLWVEERKEEKLNFTTGVLGLELYVEGNKKVNYQKPVNGLSCFISNEKLKDKNPNISTKRSISINLSVLFGKNSSVIRLNNQQNIELKNIIGDYSLNIGDKDSYKKGNLRITSKYPIDLDFINRNNYIIGLIRKLDTKWNEKTDKFVLSLKKDDIFRTLDEKIYIDLTRKYFNDYLGSLIKIKPGQEGVKWIDLKVSNLWGYLLECKEMFVNLIYRDYKNRLSTNKNFIIKSQRAPLYSLDQVSHYSRMIHGGRTPNKVISDSSFFKHNNGKKEPKTGSPIVKLVLKDK